MPNLAENIGKHRKQKMEIDNLTHNLPLWHICIQGLNNIDIVRDNKDRYMFLKKMAVAFYARERPGNIVAYCLLDIIVLHYENLSVCFECSDCRHNSQELILK